MSDLDDKLRDILDRDIPDNDEEEQALINAIKQAFAEAGYVKQPESARQYAERISGPNINRPSNTMTGQEWYNRFVKEYHMRADWISADVNMGDDAEHDVLLAAKLAAGL